MHRLVFFLLVTIFIGCGSGKPKFEILSGPDGTKEFGEMPLDAATLGGSTLTSSEFPNLKWVFHANGTHEMTNGGESLPTALNDLLEPNREKKETTAKGRWKIELKPIESAPYKMNNMWYSIAKTNGNVQLSSYDFYVYPYHSSATYVHFCRWPTGQATPDKPTRMFKILKSPVD